EAEILVVKTLSSLRDEPEVVEHESAHGRVGRIFRQGDVVLGVEVADVESRVEDDGAVGKGKGAFDDVELVVNLADQLFKNVFEGDQAEEAAEFVDHHGYARVPRAQLEKQLAGRLGFRNDQHFTQDTAEVERLRRDGFFMAAFAVEQNPEHVL